MSSSSSDRAMESPLVFPATPGMALFPLSPGRANRLGQSPAAISPYEDQPFDSPPNDFGHPEFGVPGNFGSKSKRGNAGDEYTLKSAFVTSRDAPFKGDLLPGSPPKHTRASADVHAMVSRFNSLDIKDHADLRRKDAAALKRAQMGREEAEAETKRARDEVTTLKEDIREAKEREVRVAKRLDGVMEELHRAKEAQSNAQTLYEKEIRKVRKEAFKSSSMLVKLQEELKAARNALRTGQSELEMEKKKVERREQELSAAQYQLVIVQEELTCAKEAVKTVMDERDAIRMSLREEEMQRCIVEGKLAVLAVKEEESFYADGNSNSNAPGETSIPKTEECTIELAELRAELLVQREQLTQTEEQIEFMKIECQFGCCSCRLAENQGHDFIHDKMYEAEVQNIRSAIADMLTPPATPEPKDCSEEEMQRRNRSGTDDTTAATLKPATSISSIKTQPLPCVTPDVKTTLLPSAETELNHPQIPATTTLSPKTQTLPLPRNPSEPPSSTSTLSQPPPPTTPQNIRTITTTTTVPLADAPTTDYSAFSTPTGLTREQAIEQLRQRRGRARSVASTGTPGKCGGVVARRDVSAPDLGGKGKEKEKVGSRSLSRNRVR